MLCRSTRQGRVFCASRSGRSSPINPVGSWTTWTSAEWSPYFGSRCRRQGCCDRCLAGQCFGTQRGHSHLRCATPTKMPGQGSYCTFCSSHRFRLSRQQEVKRPVTRRSRHSPAPPCHFIVHYPGHRVDESHDLVPEPLLAQVEGMYVREAKERVH